MPLRRVRFTFKTELIQRPVIYDLGMKFKIVTNIRRAEVGQDTGWVVGVLWLPQDIDWMVG